MYLDPSATKTAPPCPGRTKIDKPPESPRSHSGNRSGCAWARTESPGRRPAPAPARACSLAARPAATRAGYPAWRGNSAVCCDGSGGS